MNETYQQLIKRQREELEAFPMFFAFNVEQFRDGMRRLGMLEGDRMTIRIPGGGFIRSTDKDAFLAMFERHTAEREQAMQNEQFAYEAFLYELGNHEYCITHDVEPTLEALGLDRETVCNTPVLKRALARAGVDYAKRVTENY